MNFLGHAVFADGPEDVLFGSTMGDYIDEPKDALPTGIQDGLRLHAGLDSFFDGNPHFGSTRSYFYTDLRMKGYENLVIDICSDHIIAAHWGDLFDGDLANFASQVGAVLELRQGFLTSKGQERLQSLIEERWLTGYAHVEGLEAALNRMADRARRGHLIRDNIPAIVAMLPTLEGQVLSALPDIRAHSLEHMAQLGYSPELRIQWREGESFQERRSRGGERR